MAAANKFPNDGPVSLANPGKATDAISTSDSQDLPYITRALLLGVAGNVKVTYMNGDIDTVPLQAGFNPLQVVRVWTTGTDGGLNIHGVY